MAFSYTWPAPKFKIRMVGKFSDGRQIFSWPAGRKNFGRTGAKFSDGRMETIRTDGRKNFRTDGKFSVGRKNLGRTEQNFKQNEKFTLPLLGEFFRTSRDSSVSGQDPHKSRDVRKNLPKSGKTNFRKNNYSSGVAIVS